MKSSLPICPVPTEQQPLNEFQDLQQSWFYSWATCNGAGYIKPILILWGVGLLVSAPIAAVSFPWAKYPGQFLLSAAGGATLLPALVLVRLYSGWVYVRDRLHDETIFYEESGWYDGQTWTKPEDVLHRDRLIVIYQIQPLLRRLRNTFLVMGSLVLTGAIVWALL